MNLAAQVSSSAGTVAQGKVTFTILDNNGTPLSSPIAVSVNDSQAQLENYLLSPGLPAGKYKVHAVYGSANDFQNSTAIDQVLQIDAAATSTVTVDASAIYSPGGAVVAVSATVNSSGVPVGNGTDNVTFKVFSGAVLIATTTTPVNAGIATTTILLPPNTSAGKYAIEADYNTSPNYLKSVGTGQLLIKPDAPTISWANPADIAYGTKLEVGKQLDAKPSVPGTLSYRQLGAILHPGAYQLTVDFTPTDTTNYNTTSQTVSINVNPAKPAFSNLSASQTITFGQKTTVSGLLTSPTTIPFLETVTLVIGTATATATVDPTGFFVATIDTSVLHVATFPVSYIFSGTGDFSAAKTDTSTSLTIQQVIQTLIITTFPATIPNPVKIPNTTTISIGGNASPTIPIVIPPSINCTTRKIDETTYEIKFDKGTGPAQVIIKRPGNGDYKAADDYVLNFNVSKGDGAISLGGLNPTYDGKFQAPVATTTPANLNVQFTFTLNGNPVAAPTQAGRYMVTATINDPNYAGVSIPTAFVIGKAKSTVSWTPPGRIHYGDLLSAQQLSATLDGGLIGTPHFTPNLGQLLHDGDNQPLKVTFDVADTTNYDPPDPMTVTIGVDAAATTFTGLASSTVTFADATLTTLQGILSAKVAPAGQTVNIAIGSALNATVKTGPDGSFRYAFDTSKLGVLGSPYTVTYSFDGDGLDYQQTTDTSTKLLITPATPALTWKTPSPIVYGTPLSTLMRTAKLDIAGTPAYDFADGTVLEVGDFPLSVTYTPDSPNYKKVSATVTLHVSQASPAFGNLTLAPSLTYGSKLTLSGTIAAGSIFPLGDTVAITVGTLSVSAAVGAGGAFSVLVDTSLLDKATYPIIYSFAGDKNYAKAPDIATTFTVNVAAQAVTFANPPTTAIFAVPFRLKPLSNTPAPIDLVATNATVADGGGGTFLITPTTGSGTITIIATQRADLNHNASTPVVLNITATKIPQNVTFSNPPTTATFGTGPVVVKPLSNTPAPIDLIATNATVAAGADGTFLITPTTGTGIITITATQRADSGHDASAPSVITLTALKAPATLHFAGASEFDYTGSAPALNFTTTPSGLSYTLSYNPDETPTRVGSYDVSAKINDANYDGTVTLRILIDAVKPPVSWSPASPIAYGTGLSGAQLNAARSIAGHFVYQDTNETVIAEGSVLTVGRHVLKATLIPDDARDYTQNLITAEFLVNPAVATFTGITPPPPVNFGQATLALSGKLAASVEFPAGQTVTITIGPASAKAPVARDGSFSAPAFDLSSLGATTYPITYTLDASPLFTATPNTATSLTLVAPPVTYLSATYTRTSKGLVTAIILHYSGDLDTNSAQDARNFTLTGLGKGGKPIAIRSPLYDKGAHTITLMPAGKPFSTVKPAVQLSIHGVLDFLKRATNASTFVLPKPTK